MKVKIPGIKTRSETAKDSNDQSIGERYTDLEITSVDKYISGDITISKRQEAITGAVRNVLLTSFGEMVYDPSAGANLTELLFGPVTDDEIIIGMVSAALENDEPRVQVRKVGVMRDDDHTLSINITVNVKGDDTLQDVQLTYRIKRLKT